MKKVFFFLFFCILGLLWYQRSEIVELKEGMHTLEKRMVLRIQEEVRLSDQFISFAHRTRDREDELMRVVAECGCFSNRHASTTSSLNAGDSVLVHS